MAFDPTAAPGWHDVVGFVFTLAGFIFALVQIRKTRSSADAAAAALGRAQKRLLGDELAAVVPQMQSVVSDLDFAIRENSVDVAHRALSRFNQVAMVSVSLLDSLPEDHLALTERLRSSAASALDTKEHIVGSKSPDVARLAKKTATEIGLVAGEVGAVVAAVRYRLGEEDV